MIAPDRDPVGQLLSRLPREAPPDIPVDTILRRLAARRLALSALVVAVLALAVALAWPRSGPPVHLALRVTDVAPDADDGPSDGWAELP